MAFINETFNDAFNDAYKKYELSGTVLPHAEFFLIDDNIKYASIYQAMFMGELYEFIFNKEILSLSSKEAKERITDFIENNEMYHCMEGNMCSWLAEELVKNKNMDVLYEQIIYYTLSFSYVHNYIEKELQITFDAEANGIRVPSYIKDNLVLYGRASIDLNAVIKNLVNDANADNEIGIMDKYAESLKDIQKDDCFATRLLIFIDKYKKYSKLEKYQKEFLLNSLKNWAIWYYRHKILTEFAKFGYVFEVYSNFQFNICLPDRVPEESEDNDFHN